MEATGVAVSASMKFCIAPEIAVAIAPASARCRGSQRPSRSDTGSRSDTAASESQIRDAVWYHLVIARGSTPLS